MKQEIRSVWRCASTLAVRLKIVNVTDKDIIRFIQQTEEEISL